jgi:drug/metabolite transporter (DMT)-like permease
MIFLAEPVWAALLSALFLGERMSWNQLSGCLLILLALVVYRLQALKPLRQYFR